MSKHTPGPWVNSPEGVRGADGSIVRIGKTGLALVIGRSDVQSDANGVLVIAAPQLLAALEKLIEKTNYIGQYLPHNAPTTEVRVAIENARAALAAAKGEGT